MTEVRVPTNSITTADMAINNRLFNLLWGQMRANEFKRAFRLAYEGKCCGHGW